MESSVEVGATEVERHIAIRTIDVESYLKSDAMEFRLKGPADILYEIRKSMIRGHRERNREL